MTRRAGARAPEMAHGSELVSRVISALALALIALCGAVLGGWPATIVAAVFAAIVFREWLGITEPANRFSILLAVPVLLSLGAWTLGYGTAAGLLVLAAAVVAMIAGGWPWRAAGVIYAGAFGLSLLVLRHAPSDGLLALLFVFAVVWVTDTAAYFGGRAVGGVKLWPRISPGKTWSGAISGLVGGTLAGTVVLVVGDLQVGVVAVLVAAVLSVSSQAGDLFESWIKRRFGTKDSGTLIPGHGGLMDRVDGLIFAAVVAAAVGAAHNPLSPATGLLQW